MNFNKLRMIAAIASSILVVTVGFQNCSKVGVEDLASTNSKATGDGVPVEGEGDDDAVIDQPDDSDPTPGMPGRPNAGNPPRPGVDDGDKDCDKDDEDKDAEEVAIVKPTEATAVQLCMTATPGSISGPVIVKLRKSAVVETDFLASVTDTRKVLVIKGKTAAAHTASIVKHRGALVICNMKVDTITDTRGQIILVNSTVGVLTKHRSKPIYTVNSTIGNLIDVNSQVIGLSQK